jgi:tetratricopeptide (TPR) repeat protein
VQLAESVEQSLSLVLAYWALGRLHLQRGDLDRALPILERGVEIVDAQKIRYFFPSVASVLGWGYARSGRVDDAIRLLEAVLSQHASMRSTAGQSHHRSRLGHAYLLGGRLQDAQSTAQAALALAQQYNERGAQAYALHLLGEIELRHDSGTLDAGESSFRAGIALAHELGMRPLEAYCHLGLGLLFDRFAKASAAQEHRAAANALAGEMKMRLVRPA